MYEKAELVRCFLKGQAVLVLPNKRKRSGIGHNMYFELLFSNTCLRVAYLIHCIRILEVP